MIVPSRFKILSARSCLLFAPFKSQHNLALPVSMPCDADDEILRQRPSIAVATRDQTGIRHRFTKTGVLQQLRSHAVRCNSLAVLVSLAEEVNRFWSSLQPRHTRFTVRNVDRVK